MSIPQSQTHSNNVTSYFATSQLDGPLEANGNEIALGTVATPSQNGVVNFFNTNDPIYGQYQIEFANQRAQTLNPTDIRFVGSTTPADFDFGYYAGNNPASGWNSGLAISSLTGEQSKLSLPFQDAESPDTGGLYYCGNHQLNIGYAKVWTTASTPTCVVLLSQGFGAVSVSGLRVDNKTTGYFEVRSTNNLDTSYFDWMIVRTS
jgi:hypothetical protein